MWGPNAIFTRQFRYAHYMWEKEMQYLHDNLNYTLYVSGKLEY